MECHYLISERTYEELLSFKAKYLELKAKQKQNEQKGQQGHGCKNGDDCNCPRPGPTTYSEPQFNKLLKSDSISGLANLSAAPKAFQPEVQKIELQNGNANEIFQANLLTGIPNRNKNRAKKIVQIIIDNAAEQNGYFIINEVKYSQTHLKTLLKAVLNNNKNWLQGRQNLCDFLKLHGLMMRRKTTIENKKSTSTKQIQSVLNAPPKDWYCFADLVGNVKVKTFQPTSSQDISQPYPT